uniref:Uncharacterized protein n=1 Tax=Anguilla anguilla TaxID=7936 RepID=A0A0E9WE35_ANGAN
MVNYTNSVLFIPGPGGLQSVLFFVLAFISAFSSDPKN